MVKIFLDKFSQIFGYKDWQTTQWRYHVNEAAIKLNRVNPMLYNKRKCINWHTQIYLLCYIWFTFKLW